MYSWKEKPSTAPPAPCLSLGVHNSLSTQQDRWWPPAWQEKKPQNQSLFVQTWSWITSFISTLIQPWTMRNKFLPFKPKKLKKCVEIKYLMKCKTNCTTPGTEILKWDTDSVAGGGSVVTCPHSLIAHKRGQQESLKAEPLRQHSPPKSGRVFWRQKGVCCTRKLGTPGVLFLVGDCWCA